MQEKGINLLDQAFEKVMDIVAKVVAVLFVCPSIVRFQKFQPTSVLTATFGCDSQSAYSTANGVSSIRL